jgi:hypothetical protein
VVLVASGPGRSEPPIRAAPNVRLFADSVTAEVCGESQSVLNTGELAGRIPVEVLIPGKRVEKFLRDLLLNCRHCCRQAKSRASRQRPMKRCGKSFSVARSNSNLVQRPSAAFTCAPTVNVP